MGKTIFKNEVPRLREALFIQAKLEDPEHFEGPNLWIPGSIYENGKETYSRKEAIEAGVEIDFLAETNSCLLVEDQRRIYEQRQHEDRLNINGIVCNPDGTLMTPTQESLRCAKIAALNGMSSAIMYYEPTNPMQRTSLPVSSSQASQSLILVNRKDDRHRRIETLYRDPPDQPAEVVTGIAASGHMIQREKYIDLADEKQSYEAELFQKILQSLLILNCGNTIYAFDPAEHYFRPCSDMDLSRLINGLCGDEILRRGHLEKTYSSVCKLIRIESSIFREKIPKSPWWIWPFRDGLHDIRDGSVCRHSVENFYTYCLKCDYDPGALCPQFDLFIDTIAGNDPLIIQLLWEVIGYILSPDYSAKNLFVFFGVPSSGKSLLANVLISLIGPTCVSSLSIEDLTKNFALSGIVGKHLNVYMDLPDTKIPPEAVGKLKTLTGGDTVTTDVKYQDPVSFCNTAKMLFGSNFKLSYAHDEALYKRIVFVPFTYSIPREQQNLNLLEMLLRESSGICNKAMGAYRGLKAKNLQFTRVEFPNSGEFVLAGQHCVVNTASLMEDAIQTCFDFTGDKNDVLASADAYNAYCHFCNMHTIAPDSQSKFSRTLHNRCGGKKKANIDGHSVQVFTGIRLKLSDHLRTTTSLPAEYSHN